MIIQRGNFDLLAQNTRKNIYYIIVCGLRSSKRPKTWHAYVYVYEYVYTNNYHKRMNVISGFEY